MWPIIRELGARRSALVLDSKSRNTRENAARAAAIFAKRGWRDEFSRDLEHTHAARACSFSKGWS